MVLKVEIIPHPHLGALGNAINEKYAAAPKAIKELHFIDSKTCAIVYDIAKLD